MPSIATIDGVQYVITDDGTAHVITAATSAPAAPVAASPFAVVRTAKDAGAGLPDPIATAMAAAPDGDRQRIGRQAAAYYAVDGYSCDAAARTMSGPDGERTVGHGFITARKTGVDCPTAGCTGHIR